MLFILCCTTFTLVILKAVIDSQSSHNYWEQPFSQPYFDNSTRRDVTTTVGQTAYLHCRVRNLGDRAVSWIRKRDLHILTVGILTYTNDLRFTSLHSDGSDEWTLKIASSQLRDSGTYECQVSTEPKISIGYKLNVYQKRRLSVTRSSTSSLARTSISPALSWRPRIHPHSSTGTEVPMWSTTRSEEESAL
ncbi:hypothetical protein M8J76_004026 [Diaphorina citri]|nr:hypothetical protein M8J76_004026 [Diaphorina citri]